MNDYWVLSNSRADIQQSIMREYQMYWDTGRTAVVKGDKSPEQKLDNELLLLTITK